MRFGRVFWRRALLWGAIAVAVYFGNLGVQTHLGRRALEATGLEVHTLADGLARARAQDKLVLAAVSALWCPSCRTLDRRVLADPEVRRQIDERYVFVRVEHDSDEGRDFRRRYQVEGFPRVVVLDAAGALVKRLPVTYDPELFAAHLRDDEPAP